MKRILKIIAISSFSIVIILISAMLYDLASYDPTYLNRNSITFNYNNLNSKQSKKIFKYSEKVYFYLGYKLSKKHKKFWETEDQNERLKLPKIIKISAKKNNFLLGTKIEEIEKNFSNWPRSHGGFTSTRFSSLRKINTNNIKKLDLAWIYNSNDGKKGIQANPVVYEGLVYIPTPGGSVVCLNGKTGKEIWRFKAKNGYAVAKRGLLVWKDKKNNILKLYFTNNDQLISLNAKTGRPIKTFGQNGIIKIGSSPMTPTIIDNKIIVATSRPSIEVYDINTGKLFWKYYLRKIDKEVFNARDFESGKPWGGISSDNKNGILYLTTGNPKPYFVGIKRPGKNLFANSIIAFDIRNKKLLWYFQETCHDIWNLDIAAPPILTTIYKYEKRIDVVVAVTKLGNTLVLDRYTGEPIFDYEMKLAPTSKLPGEKTCAYQPSFSLPEPFSKNIFKKQDATNRNKTNRDHVLSVIKNSNYGFFETHEINKNTIMYNPQGGAQWTGASVDPYKNILYVTANQTPYLVKVKSTKTSNSKIFRKYIFELSLFKDLDGYPASKPPWGTLTAINLNSGKKIWQKPLGNYESLESKEVKTGTENYGGATATSGGLVFAAGTLDKFIRAFDAKDGKELWSYKLPYIGSAPPTSYEIDGEQYIVVPASGGTSLNMYYPDLVEHGDAIVAFKIKN